VPKIDIQELTKLYYSIGEVAKLLDVNASLLRFWEKEFKLEVSKKNNKGNRLFSVKEIETLNRIYQLVKEEGYTLEGAKKSLKNNKLTTQNIGENTPEQNASVSTDDEKIKEVIAKLEGIKNKLIALKDSY
jgi:DNA-binding transcriptional MerR regulator